MRGLVRRTNQRAGCGLVHLGHADSGEAAGAAYVRWPDGRRSVVTQATVPLARMRQTADHYRTSLIITAIRRAAATGLADQAIFHTDRGSNYTSHGFHTALVDLGLRHSTGRTGICYDNAMAESFFAALKNERVHRTVYPTRAHAIQDITRYIENWYNTERLHSGLGYQTPSEIHAGYREVA